MERTELLRRISTFPIAATELAKDLLAGDFRSVFRGEGIEFDEVRLYEQGDDVRSIDRNVSARYGKPYVKLYREERELTVFIVLDCSASMFVGSEAPCTRFEQAILSSALIAFSAEHSGQRLGAIFFDSTTRNVFKPNKGRSHVMAITEAALQARPQAKGTGLSMAIKGASRLLKRRSIIIIVSDFLSVGWEPEIGRISQKHDCIAIRVYDPLETDFPNVGLVSIEDPESGKTIVADSASPSFRNAWSDWNAERSALWASICKKSGTARIDLSTTEDAATVIRSFFKSRKKR
jgi:uncharacterized protein (DUF58 family)